jgi:hypothetical protein
MGPEAINVVQQLVFATLKSQQDAREQEQQQPRRRRATPGAGGGGSKGGKKKSSSTSQGTMTLALVPSGPEGFLPSPNATMPMSPLPQSQHEVGQPMPYAYLAQRRKGLVTKTFFTRDDTVCSKPRICDCGQAARRTRFGDDMPHVCIDCGTGMCATHGYAAPADEISTDEPPPATSSSSVAPYEPALADRLCQNCASYGWIVRGSAKSKTSTKKSKTSM